MPAAPRAHHASPHRGIVFPQGSIDGHADAVRAYVTGIERLGFDHLVVPDHVLGVDPTAHPGWSGPYDIDDPFHEPMVLFGFLAGFSMLELVAGVLVGPQRQAGLVAKQAADIDLLTGGRLRLGLGIGWNRPEFEGLGADFTNRGRMLDEQIELMRLLWTQRTVDYDGRFHRLQGVGITPLPTQRPIPIWIAAERDPRAFRRVGQFADGWMAMGEPGAGASDGIRMVRDAAREAGRDPDAIGIQGWVNAVEAHHTANVRVEIRGWICLGATHIAVSTRGTEPRSLAEHLELARLAMTAFD